MLVLVAGIAFWRGRPPERWASLALVGATIVSPVVEAFHAPHSVNLPILAVDGMLALVMALISIRYAHWWTIIAAGVCLFELMVHCAAMAKTGIPNHAYFVALEASSDLIIISVGFGVFITLKQKSAMIANLSDLYF